MRCFFTVTLALLFLPIVQARKPIFTPVEEQISNHRSEVFQIARDYIVDTFNLIPIDESRFNPVRFNFTGVWGDFHARVRELGNDRFEVKGWIRAEGQEKEQIVWSVVVHYELADPEAWRYLRIGETNRNEPEITSWSFGSYRSVPYDAKYSEEMTFQNIGSIK
jgi:hypothetical protein